MLFLRLKLLVEVLNYKCHVWIKEQLGLLVREIHIEQVPSDAVFSVAEDSAPCAPL